MFYQFGFELSRFKLVGQVCFQSEKTVGVLTPVTCGSVAMNSKARKKSMILLL